MKEILRTTDIALLNFVEALLDGSGLQFMIADRHISLVEGSIGAFPRRVLISEEDYDAARALLIGEGLAGELRPV